MPIKSVDYIIPVANIGGDDFLDRVQNLNYVLKTFLSNQTNVDLKVYIVEQVIGNNPTFKSLLEIPNTGLNITYKSVTYPIFTKPWLYNVGVNISSSENIILADMDAWSDKDYFHNLLDFLDDKKLQWCFGWESSAAISKTTKEELISFNRIRKENGEFIPEERGGRFGSPSPRFLEGYIVLFKRSFFVGELGGACEFLRKLGGNDNDIAFRASKTSGTYEKYPIIIAHLWHNISSMKWVGDYWDFNQTLIIDMMQQNNYAKMNKVLKMIKLGNFGSPTSLDKSIFYNKDIFNMSQRLGLE